MKPDRYDPIAAALKEDIGQGDITTDFFVPETLHATGRVTARENAIVAGTGAAAEVFRRVDPSIDIQVVRRDGDEVTMGDAIIEVRGLARSILKAERVALNFLQRLCGIATLTRQFVDAIGDHPAKILDTRKTTPGLRALEKAAVVAGGGENHRFGLYDMVLVKDNHLATFEGLSSLADRVRQLRQERPNVRIEVEADDLEQVRAFVEIEGIDVILLDNMTTAQIREAVALRKGSIIGREIIVLEQTGSTNDAVLEMARDSKEGLVLFAEQQTAGRGQRGNRWESPARKGLCFSVLLRPKIDINQSAQLTAWAAEAVSDSIQKEFLLETSIKLPNDIQINGRKVAGVLVEMRAQEKRPHLAIVGIGINANQSFQDFPEKLRDRAISLAVALGR